MSRLLFRTFTDQKLAQNAYLIGCQKTGEAIIVDPPRYYAHIVEAAQKEGMKITAAVDTHIHADYVSGARQLAVEEGAQLYLSKEGGDEWRYRFVEEVQAIEIGEGDRFSIGNIDFDVWHTPGHTPESISLFVTDRGGGATEPLGILTGDFVFVGDVGRPDLLEKAAGAKGTSAIGGRQMFESLQRFKALPEHLIVWPGHGAGSACGKSLGAVPLSTVGYELQFNWAMQIEDEETFIETLLKDQPEAPVYFARMKEMNRQGPSVVQPVVQKVVSTAEEARLAFEQTSQRIDVRPAEEAHQQLLPRSVNIPYTLSDFSTWAGWLINVEESILLIGGTNHLQEIMIALQSIGVDEVAYQMDEQWMDIIEEDKASYEFIQASSSSVEPGSVLLDVRNETEWQEGHHEQAVHHFVGRIQSYQQQDPTQKLYVHCVSGARSAIASSYLASRGYSHISNLIGSYQQLKA
ncbi:MAG TPA: MBL fold metallo-hydrolase [Savagea sp.]